MQEQYGYKMPDIMKMSKLEFKAFIDSISVKKPKEEPKVMKIDEAFHSSSEIRLLRKETTSNG